MIGIPTQGGFTGQTSNLQYRIFPTGDLVEVGNASTSRILSLLPRTDETTFAFRFGARPGGNGTSLIAEYTTADFVGRIGQGAFDSYEKSEDGFDFQTGLMRHEAGNPLGLFESVTIGRSEVEFADGTGGRERRVYSYSASVLDGDPALPSSGTVTYRGPIIGHGFGTNSRRAYDLEGSVELQVDFGARVITGTVDIGGTDREQAFDITFDTMNFTSELFQSTGNWTGQFSDANGIGVGQIQGQFNDAGELEMFGGLRLEVPDPSNAASQIVSSSAFIAQQGT